MVYLSKLEFDYMDNKIVLDPTVSIFEKNYNLLTELNPDLIGKPEDNHDTTFLHDGIRFQVHKIQEDKLESIVSISHTFLQNGEIMVDLEFILKFQPYLKMVEVLSYQDQFGVIVAYNSDGSVIPKNKLSLNNYLNKWLKDNKNDLT